LGDPRYAVGYPGFGRNDTISELYDRRDEIGAGGELAENKPGSQVLRISQVELDGTVAWPYGGLDPTNNPEGAIFIPKPYGQLRPAPLFDVTQTIDLNYWSPVGMWTDAAGHNDYWNDQMLLPGLPQPVLIMTNGTPLQGGEYTGLRSRFKVPWNAIMCFALWRADPPDTVMSRSFSVSRDDGDTYALNSSIWSGGSNLPSVGDTAIVVDDEGGEHEVTITDIIAGHPDGPTGSDPRNGYRIFVAPPLDVARTINSLTVTYDWEPPPNHRYGTWFYFGLTGTRGFCLEIPYRSDAVLWVRDQQYTGNQWKQLRPDRSTRLAAGNIYNQQIRAGRDVEYKLIWVAFTAHGIAVSTDGFVSNVGFWSTQTEAPSVSNPLGRCLGVPRGHVELRHNAGAWGFSWLPINHPQTVTVDGPVARLPYQYEEYRDHTIVTHRSPPRVLPYGFTTKDADGNDEHDKATVALTNGQPYSRVPSTGAGVEWRATLKCSVQTDEFLAAGLISKQQKNPQSTGSLLYTHAAAPELHGVRYWGWPGIKTSSLGSGEDLEVISGEISREMDSVGAVGRLVLPDQPEANYPQGHQRPQFFTYYKPRFVRLTGRWLDEERAVVPGTDTRLYTGMLAVPKVDASGPVPHTVTGEILDEAVKAVEGVSDGRVPPFDGWAVRSAVMWVLDHVGIPFNTSDIDDTGLVLNHAAGGQDPLWYVEDGRTWKDFLEEVLLYDYMGALWIDEFGYAHKGCYYCGAARSNDDTSDDWAPNHSLHGWAGAACAAYDVTRSGNEYGVDRWVTLGASYKDDVPTGVPDGLTHEATNFRYLGHLIEEEYYNHCRVKGAKHMGSDDPMSVEFTYWPSVLGKYSSPYALGCKKTQVHTVEWATSYAILYRMGRALYMRHLSAPLFIELTLPFAPELKPRDVLGVYGAELDNRGINGCRWRITALTHQMDRKTGVWATELRCRYLGVVS